MHLTRKGGLIMANGRLVENIQKFYRMAAFGISMFYVAIVLVPFTLVLIVRRVLTEVEIPVSGLLQHAQQAQSSHVKAGLANEQK
jgi:hypothetical protein